ncbi:MAG TPA: NAD(P)/FAD-dependent oxidoreductase [Micropepsaceae bacterium]|nr:NAD(P)/FAD-dependent oxidoreductase [Micropepsaceae bacterium]
MNARRFASNKYDAVIIGGSIGGLVAASYLARGEARVLLVEQSDRFGGRTEMVELGEGFRAPVAQRDGNALDGRVLRDLRLARHGLQHDKRDMKLVALRPGGQSIALSLRGSTPLTWRGDAPGGSTYAAFCREASAWARRLSRVWDGSLDLPDARGPESRLAMIARRLQLSDWDQERFEYISQSSAAGFLNRWFEDDALKAALSLEVFASGLSPEEAGSALVLIWRYGQSGFGQRAAPVPVRGGPDGLAGALKASASSAGAELRTNASVKLIIVEKKRVVGVMLASGELIAAGAVLSSLDARRTLLELVPPECIGFGAAASLPEYQRVATARLIMGLKGLPPFAGLEPRDLASRIVIAERSEIAAEAKRVALLGRLPEELVMEASIPSVADPDLAPAGRHVLIAVLPYMPVVIEGGWQASKEHLRRRTLATLESFAPGLKDRVVTHWLMTPEDIANRYGGHAGEPGSPSSRLLASYESRIRTPFAGLYLCGASAEPVSNHSGRAARIAVGLVFAEWAGRKGRKT